MERRSSPCSLSKYGVPGSCWCFTNAGISAISNGCRSTFNAEKSELINLFGDIEALGISANYVSNFLTLINAYKTCINEARRLIS
jgi:hypothetical protein